MKNKFNKLAISTAALTAATVMNVAPASAESDSGLTMREIAIQQAHKISKPIGKLTIAELSDAKELKTRITDDGTITISQKGGPEVDQPFATVVYTPVDGQLETFLQDRQLGIRNEARGLYSLDKDAKKLLQNDAKDGAVSKDVLAKVIATGSHLLGASVTDPNMNEMIYKVNYHSTNEGMDAYIEITEHGYPSLPEDITRRQAEDFSHELGDALNVLTNDLDPS